MEHQQQQPVPPEGQAQLRVPGVLAKTKISTAKAIEVSKPQEVKIRLAQQQSNKVNNDGELVVTSQEHM